jgi:hypothetical protein
MGFVCHKRTSVIFHTAYTHVVKRNILVANAATVLDLIRGVLFTIHKIIFFN